MFAEVKDTLPISGDDYDGWIIREIKAAALDLTPAALRMRLTRARRALAALLEKGG